MSGLRRCCSVNDVATRDASVAGVGQQLSTQHADSCSFAGAVMAQEAKYLSRLD